MLRTARSPRSSASPAASAARPLAPPASASPRAIARSRWCIECVLPRTLSRPGPSLPLHIDGVALDTNRVGRDVAGDGAAQELAGAHVEARIVQRTLDHVAHQLAGGERRARVAADVAEGIEGAADVRDQHPLAIDDDPLHRA